MKFNNAMLLEKFWTLFIKSVIAMVSLVGFFYMAGLAYAQLDNALIKDVKPPVAWSAPWPWWSWLILLLVVFVIAGLGLWLSKRSRQQPKAKEPPSIPAWVIAKQALAELEKQTLPQKGEWKLYYSQLSDILRRFLESRFQLRAPEMTTEEFFYSLDSSSHLNVEQRQLIKSFLMFSDMVKFAKLAPLVKDAEKAMRDVRLFVEQTTPGHHFSEDV